MRFGEFEIDDFVIAVLAAVILILGLAFISVKLDYQAKEIERLKLELQIEQVKALNENTSN